MNREFLVDCAVRPLPVEEQVLTDTTPNDVADMAEVILPAREISSPAHTRRLAVWLAGVITPGLVLTGVSLPAEQAAATETHTASNCAPVKGVAYIAHRGTGQGMFGHYAEDTNAAALRGIQLGADAVENDIQETKDGVAVMQHDRTWDRMTNARGLIGRTPSSRLSSIRTSGGAKVATLDSYVKTVAQTCAAVMLENKRGLSGQTLKHEVALVDKHFEDPSRVVFSASEPKTLARLKQLCQDRYQTALIIRSRTGWPNVQKLSRKAIDILNVDYRAITRQRVQAAHRRGFLVSARNVDSAAIFIRMKNQGIDRVVGDINEMSDPRQLLSRR